MTSNSIDLASRILRIVKDRRALPRQRRGLDIRLENLEARLALSSYSAGSFHVDLNPQPLPPGVRTVELDTVLHMRKQAGGQQEIDKSTPTLNLQPQAPGQAVHIVQLQCRGHENSNNQG